MFMVRGLVLLIVVLGVMLSTYSHAENLDLAEKPKHLPALANKVGPAVGKVSLDDMSMGFDSRTRKLWLGVNAGSQENFKFRINTDVKFVHGSARVITKIHLGPGGSEIRLQLPDIGVIPSRVASKRTLEVRVTLLSGSF